MESETVHLVVGNTHKRIPSSEASWNRKRTHRKEHDWTLFVDVVRGNADVIRKVEFVLDDSFRPKAYTHHSPVQVTLRDGSRVMRFSTRQQSSGAIVAQVNVLGQDGSKLKLEHPISLEGGVRRKEKRMIVQTQPRPTTNSMGPTPSDVTFGIELELSCARGSTREQVAHAIKSKTGVNATVITTYAQAHVPVQGWKLVHDGSIHCSPSYPDCSRFELVSPVLRGSAGMDECKKVLQALDGLQTISVNKSMGFHVHIGVDTYSLPSLIHMCQNFIKYEDAIDTFMPPSRRTGSRESNQYFRSNKAAVAGSTNLERHKALAACTSKNDLSRIMNPRGRYYKLNLQNLVTGRQPTVEFRQHSATSSYQKVRAWIRFCMAMVRNSERLKAPSALKNSRTANEQFDMLFQYVIKNRALRDAYKNRRDQVESPEAACCDGCAHGRRCLAQNE